MNSQLRNIEFNIYNLSQSKEFYKKFFIGLGYIINEEDELHIKFRTIQDDFTLINSTKPIDSSEINTISIWLPSKKDVDKFYNTFIKVNDVKISEESTILQKKSSKDYYISFADPNNIKWKIFHNSTDNNLYLKEDLRKSFIKEFIYSFLLFPYGLVYTYRLIFKYNHKIAGLICFIITIATLFMYIFAIQQLSSTITNALNSTSLGQDQFKNLGY